MQAAKQKFHAFCAGLVLYELPLLLSANAGTIIRIGFDRLHDSGVSENLGGFVRG
jgi:hypothetical protein